MTQISRIKWVDLTRSATVWRKTEVGVECKLHKRLTNDYTSFDNPPIFNNIEMGKDGMIRARYVVVVFCKHPISREAVGVPAKLRSRFVG